MYTETKIWSRSLGNQGDSFDPYRERLRATYSKFRERVGNLIQHIPSDTLGLTVHDLTHLDALWEMADILTDDSFILNPAEAFVFGGAILLHDSAMTICSYKGGIDEIRSSPEYSDAIAQFRANFSSKDLSRIGTTTAEAFALNETLRIKHASKAEELALQQWESQFDGDPMFLIDDTEFRDHYGRSIGRIAHSHHWNISDVPKNFIASQGAFSGFPQDWKVDLLKIALLLRCVDAMQIDDRRAPKFLASLRIIGTDSMEHWRFQNKLTQPHVDEGRIVYTSKSPFLVDEANAWNLCFDTLQMIDRELRDSNDLLLKKNLPKFTVNGVAGAGSADALAQYVEVQGWRPLPLNLKVSNVPNLARTLGGKDLYNSPLSPLRELIQNSADAVEARTLIDDEFLISDGKITIRFIESDSETMLEIDDNGIGMSEGVLTTALLDFGFSFWKSSYARTEFPGLQSEAYRFRGRYGIGFFSIFMWSSEIIVSSRRFNEGIDAARVLEFRQGIESRPILRAAASGEKSTKWTTRIRLKLDKDFFDKVIPNPSQDYNIRSRYEYRHSFFNQNWIQRLRLLCGALPINVLLEKDSRSERVSLPEWRECSNEVFANFFNDVIFKNDQKQERFIPTLTKLSELPPMGGRCFISPYNSDESKVAVYEKGIFIGFEYTKNIFGVAESKAINAARDRHSRIDLRKDKEWIECVRSKAFAVCRNIGEKIELQSLFVSFDVPDPNQPMFICNREFISLSELKRKVKNNGIFFIRLTEESENEFSWKLAENLSIITGLSVDESRVFPLVKFRGAIGLGQSIENLVNEANEPLFNFLKEICAELGPSSSIKSEYVESSGYRNDYIDIFIQ
ncbi:hypothetical protein EHR01_10720 [Leptospira mtsangambouensis]|uniref:HD-CE domain-containing protein n=1 Tax=Leptospira mtsangambouensis TaxID=2484912 RepID=A0ABY2NXZ1_9LEPT|nr:ATP-binding protein [Leptospira mtsangambouensis]TGM73986.1 hypothetical protein EHR01_10720 [Leptospira mtsangambouensis]